MEVAADALRDADEGQRLRGDALVLVLPRLLLAPGRSSGSSRSNGVVREVAVASAFCALHDGANLGVPKLRHASPAS